MHNELAALAARQHGVVSRPQARALGISRHAIRHLLAKGLWVAVGPRVLQLLGAPITPLTTLMSAVLDAGPGAVVSHRSAAALWRIPGFALLPAEVTRPRPASRREAPTPGVHHPLLLPDDHVRSVGAFAVTSPSRTLFDLAGVVHPQRFERAVDSAVAMRLTSYSELARLLDDYAKRGRPGSAALRAVLAERDVRARPVESELEARFLALVRRHGLPEPERQVVLGTGDQPAGRVDFLFRATNVVVEVDGARHHSSVLDREADARRDLVLLRGGRRVVRLTWRQVTASPDEVAAALADILRSAAA